MVAGYADEVQLLFKRGAKADALSKDGETPLLLAAFKTNKNRARIIQLLHAKIPSSAVDATSPVDGTNTPLMFVARASLTLMNDDGYNAKDLDDKTYDRVVTHPLNLVEKANLAKLIELVINKVADDIVWRAHGISIDLDEAWDQAVNRGEGSTTAALVEKVNEPAGDSPIERFLEDKEDFVQEVAKNAVELQNDTSTTLDSPEVLPKTSKVALYQQAIYCDVSGSMKREDRWKSQKNLVERTAKITTRVLPKGEGVALRFINQEVDGSSNLGLEHVANILAPLKWDDYVPKCFGNPLLISILTDDGPKREPGGNTLKNAIVECGQRMKDVGFPRESEHPHFSSPNR
ncbi:uncharacterized protein Z519_09258 [Cladophialophora bantiana CBS 173.52]|uniref:Ankyrin repeat protein n=1 Tax=Cladophialophora bantiana (strain ATCC 10958 / CBS 173.52 / CDC B-1940 / NIH 8579) TaxID=1442370 RepID=A0A0D2HZ03_CLAB1|nr:uncharacterized protein Z519_09258 [Cladophialophora bantiana CBS 173.52]KIW89829.1 hypothetical protein Z519_09258 [Cladophialophora bantiana CBS 173.52]